MYSLLSQIPVTGKDIVELNGSLRSSLTDSTDTATLYSHDTGVRGLNEDEKRLVGMSTISVVTRLALEFRDEEVRSRAVLSAPLGYKT
jgi:phosphatidylinositol 4-kinase A